MVFMISIDAVVTMLYNLWRWSGDRPTRYVPVFLELLCNRTGGKFVVTSRDDGVTLVLIELTVVAVMLILGFIANQDITVFGFIVATFTPVAVLIPTPFLLRAWRRNRRLTVDALSKLGHSEEESPDLFEVMHAKTFALPQNRNITPPADTYAYEKQRYR